MVNHGQTDYEKEECQPWSTMFKEHGQPWSTMVAVTNNLNSMTNTVEAVYRG